MKATKLWQCCSDAGVEIWSKYGAFEWKTDPHSFGQQRLQIGSQAIKWEILRVSGSPESVFPSRSLTKKLMDEWKETLIVIWNSSAKYPILYASFFFFSHYFKIHGIEQPLERAPCSHDHGDGQADKRWHYFVGGGIIAVVLLTLGESWCKDCMKDQLGCTGGFLKHEEKMQEKRKMT